MGSTINIYSFFSKSFFCLPLCLEIIIREKLFIGGKLPLVKYGKDLEIKTLTVYIKVNGRMGNQMVLVL